MQLFVLALFIGIFAEPLLADKFHRVDGGALVLLVIVPKLLSAILYWLTCWWTARLIADRIERRPLRRLERVKAVYHFVIVALYYNDLMMGVIGRLREGLADWVMVNELIVMSMPLALLAWSWWVYYPIERRLRGARAIDRLDRGLSIQPMWTRGQFLMAQLRYQVALVLVPMLLLLAMIQVIEASIPSVALPALGNIELRVLLQILGGGCIFLFAPAIIRRVWDTAPLPDGPLREQLTTMCRQHRVGVRELLVWQTYGGMVNAAVMGLIRPLRYILLSDALLETLHLKHIEAVMAHELAHVSRRHMFWLLAAAAALFIIMERMWTTAIGAAELDVIVPLNDLLARHIGLSSTARSLGDVLIMVMSFGSWAIAFGWVSRRFERQADTFAVQHLAVTAAPQDAVRVTIDEVASGTMIDALEQVAVLNQIDPGRRSWRHGSIQWRQRYLRGIVGRPIDLVPIDRQVAWIKRFAAVILLFMIGRGVLF